jgi:predicted transcriptional regulator
MHPPRTANTSVIEVIPSDRSLDEKYPQWVFDQAVYQQAIDAGIADADAGNLISLATVEAKWLSR